MPYETIEEHCCFGGVQGFYSHRSKVTDGVMRFALYTPPQAADRPVPILYYLSGLTCTEENFTVKAGAQRYAAEHGLMLVAPDTSPRGEGIPDDPAYDLGTGAGFYVDALQDPWKANYQMYSYVTDELPALVEAAFPGDPERCSIFGHSMGGHGALIIALYNQSRYRSVSAFAPIVAPSRSDWGKKIFQEYLGGDSDAWAKYDTCALIEAGYKPPGTILVDQGVDDEFLERLMPEALKEACEVAHVPLELRMRDGYDHSYYFVQSFVGEHIAFHAAALKD